MSITTGLLLLNSSGARLAARSRSCLTAAATRLSGILYVYPYPCKVPLTSNLVPNGPGLTPVNNSPSLNSRLNSVIYNHASAIGSPSLEVRLLLHNNRFNLNRLSKTIEWIFVEPGFPDLEKFLADYSLLERSKSGSLRVQYLEKSSEEGSEVQDEGDAGNEVSQVDTVIIGGTFDRIHNGHRILLTESALRCTREFIVGVTDESMIKRKSLSELVEPLSFRMAQVENFLADVAPQISHRVVPISDPYGPTIVEENIDLIVVSEETLPGAQKVNEIRLQKNFHPLTIHTIQLSSDPQKQSHHEEDKLSSSSKRLRTLGLRLRPALKPPSVPYIVGLTGGIASGKSKMCRYLDETLGVPIVDCDKLGHEAYLPGTPCFNTIVATFGKDILCVTENGEVINRRCLGSKVFGKPAELKKLTDIVWPEIRRLALGKIRDFAAVGHRVIVVDAAVLLEGGWEDMCHDVWVTFIPRNEAVQRIIARDNLSIEDAERRIDSQLSNEERISKATFVFSSLWEPEFTQTQVKKAWDEIQTRIQDL